MIEGTGFSLDSRAPNFLSIVSSDSCVDWEKYVVLDPAFIEEGRSRAIPINGGTRCSIIAFRIKDGSFVKTEDREVFVESEEDLSEFRYERAIITDKGGKFVVLWDQSDISLTFVRENGDDDFIEEWLKSDFVHSLNEEYFQEADAEFSDYVKLVQSHYRD